MTHTETFIRDAIEGGYSKDKCLTWTLRTGNVEIVSHVFFIDPSFWKAVGKMRGWENEVDRFDDPERIGRTHIERMHRLIDALAEADEEGIGQQEAIENYLGTI